MNAHLLQKKLKILALKVGYKLEPGVQYLKNHKEAILPNVAATVYLVTKVIKAFKA